jgi:dTDP-glucose pyrophosphorylase
MLSFRRHLIHKNATVRDALTRLDALASNAILFLIEDDDKLIGSLTDGDLRRGFINGLGFEDLLIRYIQPNPKFVNKTNYSLKEIVGYREKNINILPVLNDSRQIVNVINLRHLKSYLPVDAIIMAGGRGERLKPLTDTIPKPLLPVGGKAIIEHNVDRLHLFGVDDIWISVRYLGDKIKSHLRDGAEKSLRIQYIEEETPLGTVGAIKLANGLTHDSILVMNSDLLTNINFEDFYLFFEKNQADMAVACIPYQVNVPYAVMETNEYIVTGFREKPTYTHYSNAGIYLMRKSVLDFIPDGVHFHATDLMQTLLSQNKKVCAYPLMNYWLDIGKHEDYKKAQEDILHLAL